MSKDWLDITEVMEACDKRIPVTTHPDVPPGSPLAQEAKERPLFISEIRGIGPYKVSVEHVFGTVPMRADGTHPEYNFPIFIWAEKKISNISDLNCHCPSPKPILLLFRTVCDNCGKEIG